MTSVGVVNGVGDNYKVYSLKEPQSATYLPKQIEKTDVLTFKNAGVKEKPETGKRIIVGMTSFFIPGLGQAINGQWNKALSIFAGAVGLGMLSVLAGSVALSIFPAVAFAYRLWASYDAAKNTKA